MSTSLGTIRILQIITDKLLPILYGRQRRIFLAVTSEVMCHGGITTMSEISGSS